MVQGGLRILERIEAMRYRSLSHRPTLGRTDWPVMVWRACWMPRLGAAGPAASRA